METSQFDKILTEKNEEMKQLYDIKMSKNKKMNIDVNTIDYNSKKTFNNIQSCLDKKLKSSKAYKKKYDQEHQFSNCI